MRNPAPIAAALLGVAQLAAAAEPPRRDDAAGNDAAGSGAAGAAAQPRPSAAAIDAEPGGADPAAASPPESPAAASKSAATSPVADEDASAQAVTPRVVPDRFIEEEPVDSPPEQLPTGRDTSSGHLQIAAQAGLVSPLGSLESGRAQEDSFGVGTSFRLDAGFGVSRTVVLGLAGGYTVLNPDPDCARPCGGSSIGVGPFIRYHLVQGLRFDPWVSFGVGFRQTHLEGGPVYTGIDWAQLTVGGDWYPWTHLGIGPTLDLDFTTFLNRDDGGLSDASVAASLILGARIVYDTPGK